MRGSCSFHFTFNSTAWWIAIVSFASPWPVAAAVGQAGVKEMASNNLQFSYPYSYPLCLSFPLPPFSPPTPHFFLFCCSEGDWTKTKNDGYHRLLFVAFLWHFHHLLSKSPEHCSICFSLFYRKKSYFIHLDIFFWFSILFTAYGD